MMKRIQDITVGIISLVLLFIMITVLNRVIFSATECPDWIPFPPDYHSVHVEQIAKSEDLAREEDEYLKEL